MRRAVTATRRGTGTSTVRDRPTTMATVTRTARRATTITGMTTDMNKDTTTPMVVATAIATTTDGTVAPGTTPLPAAALLQLMWLASPALPVGGFSYSEGLEAAVDAGIVTAEASARDWLLDQLALVQARSDLAAAAAAFAAWQVHDADRVRELNAWVAATRETAELRLQSEQTGRSLAQWLRARVAGDPRVDTLERLAPPTWPVAFALAAATTGAPLRDALLAMAFGWAENQVQAAVRALPLGQSAGQRILGALADVIPAAVDDALARSDDTRQSFAPMLAVLSARHENQYSRLFRS